MNKKISDTTKCPHQELDSHSHGGAEWLLLTLKAPNHHFSRRHSLIFFHCFSEKIRLDFSSESSARQRIHMKNQALFSSKDKSKTRNVTVCNKCPRRSLIMTLIPGCDLEHSQGTSLAQDVTCHFVLLFCVTLTLGKEP